MIGGQRKLPSVAVTDQMVSAFPAPRATLLPAAAAPAAHLPPLQPNKPAQAARHRQPNKTALPAARTLQRLIVFQEIARHAANQENRLLNNKTVHAVLSPPYW